MSTPVNHPSAEKGPRPRPPAPGASSLSSPALGPLVSRTDATGTPPPGLAPLTARPLDGGRGIADRVRTGWRRGSPGWVCGKLARSTAPAHQDRLPA